MNKKSQNYFSLNEIDRMTFSRTKKENVEKMLYAPNTLIIPVCKSKNMVSSAARFKAVFLKLNDIKGYQTNDFIFMGKYNGKNFFTIELKDEMESKKIKSYKFEDLRKIAPLLNFKESALLAYARAIIYWRSRTKYCGICGNETRMEEGGHRAFCPKCNSDFFPRTDPAIITIVTSGEKCLLARQSGWLPKRYSTIAGFVEPGESLEDAVSREVFEETGIKIKNIRYHSSQPWPFPGSLMIGFTASAQSTKISLHDHELEDARWFSRKEIAGKLKQKELKLSAEISISFRLIEDWFNSGSEILLRELLKGLS